MIQITSFRGAALMGTIPEMSSARYEAFALPFVFCLDSLARHDSWACLRGRHD